MGLIYSLRKFIAEALYKKAAEIDLRLIKKSCLGHVDGIAICDGSIARHSPDVFLKFTREAMALIHRLDPRRYRRVRQQLDYIVNRELVEGGNFEQKLKACNVDFSKFPIESQPNRSRRHYACLLIHEATHGFLFAKGIPYDKDTRLSVERLCHLEEYRFASHFEPGWADKHIGPFDSEKWKLTWGPQRDRTAASWKRFREALKAAFGQEE